MEKCARCSLDAKFKATKRLLIFPSKPIFLCDIHAREHERTSDRVIVIGLAIAIVLALLSLNPLRFLTDNKEIQAPSTAAAPLVADLDGDGRVAWFEEQAFATPEAMANFRKTGYPFAKVLLPDSPTRAIRKKINVAAFLEAAQQPNEKGQTLLHKFNHPLLMKRFVDRHAKIGAKIEIRALFLTHDPYLAFVLARRGVDERTLICLEKLSPDQEAAIDLLEAEVVKTTVPKMK